MDIQERSLRKRSLNMKHFKGTMEKPIWLRYIEAGIDLERQARLLEAHINYDTRQLTYSHGS
jgi:hypothetical protein